MLASEDRSDGDDVFRELDFWRCSHVFVLNQEIGSVGSKDPLDEFEAKTGDSISVGNHNLPASSVHR